MARIHLLEDQVINKIAAGEVVERPASVVKELVENAIDAGSTEISVELEDGGQKRITVRDNGFGLSPEDVYLAVTRHATSKIRSVDDLFVVSSMGFRGEALASIASVSRFSIAARERGAELSGLKVTWEGGENPQELPWPGPVGTTVTVEDLFYNVPARRQFLKSANIEFAACLELLQSLALSNAGISLALSHGGKEKMRVLGLEAGEEPERWGETRLRARARDVLGWDDPEGLLYVREEGAYGTFEGLVSAPGVEKATAKHMLFFVNGRWVKDKVLRYGILRGYQSHLLKGRYPQVLGHFYTDPSLVDVNVHPTKTELRFQYGGEVQGLISGGVRKALRSGVWAAGSFGGLEEGAGESRKSGGRNGGDLSTSLPSAGQSIIARSVSEEAIQLRGSRIASAPQLDCFAPLAMTEPPLLSSRADLERAQRVGREAERSPAQGARTWGSPFVTNGSESTIPWDELTLLGTFDNCYLMFQHQEQLLVVDQHAFHERVLFEKLCGDKSQLCEQQKLMIPEVIDLRPSEISELATKQEAYAALGFDYAIIDENTLEVRGVPSLLTGKVLDRLFSDLAKQPSAETLSAHEGVLATIACHSAVRAGEALGPEEWKSLLREARTVDFYHNCPHGRRVFKWFSKRQVETWFDRT